MKNLIPLFSLLVLLPVNVLARDIYLGVGLGKSSFNPDTDQQDTDVFGNSYQLLAGYEFNDTWAAEFRAVDLGRVKFRPKGSTDYITSALSVVYRKNLLKGSPWDWYALAGMNTMTRNSDSVAIKRRSAGRVHLGAGLQYNINTAWAAKGDWVYYDKDARTMSFSLVYRFGQAEPQATFSDTLLTAVTPPINQEIITVQPEVLLENEIVEPAHNDLVDAKAYSIDLSAIKFNSNSAELLPESRARLQELIQGLREQPALSGEVRGYTDSSGNAQSNQVLSEQRAIAVRAYLIGQGIAPQRIRATGYGIKDPIANNATKQGREQNRRIVFIAD